jgi:hypothetical protein
VDSDWCDDVDDPKRTSGYAPIVILSTCEVEYVVASLGVSHAIWLRRLLQKLKCSQLVSTKIQVDNKSAIELVKNLVYHERSKHIDVRFHSIREYIKDEEV